MALSEVDKKLIERCLAHQPQAWEDFVDRFLGLVVHVINHTGQSRSVHLTEQDREDFAAEVFVAILSDNFAVLRRFRGNSSLATYLTVIARRIIVKEMAKRRMAEAMGHVGAHPADVAANDGHERRLENRDEVERLLAGLPRQDAEIVRLYHLQGRSYREISREVGVPENTIGPTLSRARQRLRDKSNRDTTVRS